MTPHDRRLGMDSRISRRDFLNGVAVGVGGAMAAGFAPGTVEAFLAQDAAGYPPALTGLRGSHAGSFEVLHRLRDGAFWTTAGTPVDTREEYDLVVVGAGISGLAAAHTYRRATRRPHSGAG
ncbi:MAG: twin-arginine translocation signal domain-containing protein [Vicinamibacterales bacterium]